MLAPRARCSLRSRVKAAACLAIFLEVPPPIPTISPIRASHVNRCSCIDPTTETIA